MASDQWYGRFLVRVSLTASDGPVLRYSSTTPSYVITD